MKHAFVTMTIANLIMLCGIAITDCGAGSTVCTVIDAAHGACAVIRYLGPDGKMHEQHVSGRDLARHAQALASASASSSAK